MAGSSFMERLGFKSPLRVIVWVLLKSRELARAKLRGLREELVGLRGEVKHLNQERASLLAELSESKAETQRLKRELAARSEEVVRTLPDDPPLGTHGYGARMVELALRLAQAVGFRRAARVMEIFFVWLDLNQRVPHHTTIRGWMQRMGVAAISAPVEKADDWIWMADHSNQIGQDKILVVLAVRASQLPPRGTALRQEDM